MNSMEEEKEVAAMAAAERYLATVRDNYPSKYHEFLLVVNDRSKSIADVASRVRELFRDRPSLIAGFNAFLPEGYQIEVEVDERNRRFFREASSHPKEFEEKMEKATRYVQKVRDTLEKDNPAKHDEFLDVLSDFRNHRIGHTEVASRVKALFRDCPSLLAGFNAFLPEGYKIQVIGVDELANRVVRDLTLDDHNDDYMSQ